LSVWTDFSGALRNAILVQERIDLLAVAVDLMTHRLQDHDRRLVRIQRRGQSKNPSGFLL
jgi:hypothetical protein